MTKSKEVPEHLVKTAEVIGVDVQNPEGESLGKVEEIILDKVKGGVVYAVLSFGGFLGMGDKLFALPWSALDYDEDKDSFIINVPQDKLKNAPGFDKDSWPNMADKEFGLGLEKFYGSNSNLRNM